MKLRANLAFVNFPSAQPAASREFYSRLLGIDMGRSLYDRAESYHAPISSDGVDLNINVRHSPQETPTAFFAVDDLRATLKEVEGWGGKVVWGPERLDIPQAYLEDYKRNVKEEWPDLQVSDDMTVLAR